MTDEATQDRIVRLWRGALNDALRHAIAIATRGQEATEGTPDIFLFDAAARAIADLQGHPAMVALAGASVRHFIERARVK